MGPRTFPMGQWKGKYEFGKVDLKYFLPVYTWERHGIRSFGVKGVLSMVPNVWISKCFRYVVFPKNDFYYLGHHKPATTEDFVKGFLVPDRKTWVEYSVVLWPRRNGCKKYFLFPIWILSSQLIW